MVATRYLSLAFVALAGCARAPLEPPSQPLPATDRSTRLQSVLDETVRKGMPAIAARVQTESWTWSGVAGVVSVEAGEPLREDHRFRLASVTKLFTEVVIMQMVDEGALALDDKLIDLLVAPTVAQLPYASEITLEQLVNHTSGIRNFSDPASFWRSAYAGDGLDRTWAPEALIGYALEQKSYAKPGESFHYSSSNYVLLGMIIEAVSSQPLNEVYRERIFDVLGLRHTFLEGYDPGSAGVLDSYFIPRGEGMNWWRLTQRWKRVSDDRLINMSREYAHYNAWAWAAGGLNSTTGDLATFFNAVRAGSLLSEHSRAIIRAHSTFEDVGIQRPRFSHAGGWDGISAVCEEIGEDMVIIVLMNGTGIADISQQTVFGDIYKAAIQED